MGRKRTPGRFTDLDAFVQQIRRELAEHREPEPLEMVVIWSGTVPRSGTREIAPGLYARSLGRTAQGRQAYAVNAADFLLASEDGRMTEYRKQNPGP